MSGAYPSFVTAWVAILPATAFRHRALPGQVHSWYVAAPEWDSHTAHLSDRQSRKDRRRVSPLQTGHAPLVPDTRGLELTGRNSRNNSWAGAKLDRVLGTHAGDSGRLVYTFGVPAG